MLKEISKLRQMPISMQELLDVAFEQGSSESSSLQNAVENLEKIIRN